MRKLITIILCLLLTMPALAQQVIVAKKKSGGTPVTRTDDFNRDAVNPIGGNWTTVTDFAALKIAGGDVVTASTEDNYDYAAYWNADSFAANQFSQAEATGPSVGVVVRVNGSACYLFRRTTEGTFQLWKMPGWIQLGSDYTSVSFTDGQIIRLEATGTSTTTLTPIVNGISLTAYNDEAGGADGDPITSGGVGLYCVVMNTSQLDDWTGGEL